MVKQIPNSLAGQVFERLEHDILAGIYPRGTILTELQLSADLEVSRTPIREALRRLEQEHIIESTGKGMRVLSITDDDINAIFSIRQQVERLAAENCVDHITDEQIAHLNELVELQEFYLTKNNPKQLKSIDSEFHRCIYQSCNSPIYYDTLMPLLTRIYNVRRSSLAHAERAATSIQEHKTILEAIRSRDSEAAGKAMFDHVSHAADFVTRRFELPEEEEK